ncbi:hypothetical protein DL764_000684 [Monosporascus ibericus]|uniref:Ribosome assembly protein 3 n=1 Tax=Monosporascus ibericus TaxID=155417 RepID=A0A4Q4TXF7_9PEZI|nr:hypothetical protein DL764_000684 [Monosporascus ibericus]
MSPRKDNATASADFTSYYLQRATTEFSEDLDKIRGADDFKGRDALPMLVQSLQQGTSMFSAADRKRILDARERESRSEAAGDDNDDKSKRDGSEESS